MSSSDSTSDTGSTSSSSPTTTPDPSNSQTTTPDPSTSSTPPPPTSSTPDPATSSSQDASSSTPPPSSSATSVSSPTSSSAAASTSSTASYSSSVSSISAADTSTSIISNSQETLTGTISQVPYSTYAITGPHTTIMSTSFNYYTASNTQGQASVTASAHVSKPLSSQASAGISIAVLAAVLAIISAIVFGVKRRKHRKSEILDSWIKALEEKQAEAKEMGSAPTVIEGVTITPPPATKWQQKRESRPGLDEEMLNEMRKGPYGSVHRAQRIQRAVRFSVHADHGPP